MKSLFNQTQKILATLVSCFLLILVAACEQSYCDTITPNGSQLELPAGVYPVEFATGIVTVHSSAATNRLKVEIATSSPQHKRGLMYRKFLPETSGMLFIFPQMRSNGFWMLNTFIPLSVAYADETGVISQIVDMTPCVASLASECAGKYPAHKPFRLALEVNYGYFARQGIHIGDRIELVETESTR